MPRKIAIIAAATLGVLLLLLITVPLLFRGQIAERVEAEVEEAVRADVQWEGVGLSLLRNFPNITFRMDGLTVTGIEAFEGQTLASVPDLRVVLDLRSVLGNVLRGDQIVVRAVDLRGPTLHLRVLDDGTANWDIAREPAEPEPAEPEEPRAVDVGLRSFTVQDGTITLDDRQAGLTASLAGFDQSLSGDFTRDRFVLRTRASADEASVRFGGMPYLNRTRLELRAEVDADMVERRFTFRENELRLNDLPIAFAGSAAAAGDDLALDLSFETPRTEFRHLLSLVPAVYARDFESLETSGAMSVSGRVQGAYGEEAFPSFALNAAVEDGTFRYPDLPLPAREIFLDLSVDNPGGDLDNTVVDLRRFHIVIGDDPIDAALVLRTPVSDPDVDFRVAGRLDLADLARTVKLEGVEELSGVVDADAALRARLSFVDRGEYERITARGGANARNVTLRSEDLPHPVMIEEAALALAPRHAELTTFRAQIGESDLQLAGHLDNILGYALRDEHLRGEATFQSRHFDLNEWRSDEEIEVIPVPANVDFTLDTRIEEMVYGTLRLTDVRGQVHLEDRRVTLDDFRAEMLGGGIALDGFYETTDVTRPTFDVRLGLTELDIPRAFEELTTVRMLAPVAEYARGTFSTDLQLSGALDEEMMPLFEVLGGRGSLQTSRLVLQDFPPLDRMADALRIPQLRDPEIAPVRASIEIRDGRLHTSPFDVELDRLTMIVSGSQGIDRTLQYALRLAAPREILGAEAGRVVEGLLDRAGRAGIDLGATDVIELGIQLTGTVTDPSIEIGAGEALATVREGVERPVREEAERRLEEAERRAEETLEGARAEAREEADRLIRQAEARADEVREEARRLAETVRREGYARADSLVERATEPVARVAAQAAANRLRRETDEQADRIIREADRRADEIVAEARRQAGEVEGGPADTLPPEPADTLPGEPADTLPPEPADTES